MKANKIFAAAMAALTLVGFSACQKNNGTDPQNPEDLTLNETALSLTVGESHDLVASVTVETWTSSNEQVATVIPANDGKTAKVNALAEGNAIISATAKGVTKTCVVAVKKAGGQGGESTVKGSQIWPIAMDGVSSEANASKIVADFRPDDVANFLYVWDQTYVANDNPTGKNFAGNNEGYTALTVSTIGWAGCGYCLTASGEAWQAAAALKEAIVADPDNYFLHMAIKSTDNGSHCFYFMGSEATKFVLGGTSVYDGPIYANFTRDGSWAEFDIPMSSYAAALASTNVEAGVNVFVALSEGTAGVQLNMDAIYFYKK